MKNSLEALSDKLAKILGQLKEIDAVAGTLKAGGQGSNGVMSGSLSTVSTVAQPFSLGGTLMKMGGAALTSFGGVAAGMSQMMPDVQMTIARRAGFYQAGVASGGIMSHSALESSVRLGLGKFSTSQGSDAVVAAMLTTRGMVPGTATFNNTVTAVGQAARYLNMPNEVAASALENLTSGPTSAMMMRNFGVFTSNPRTGEAMGQAQIFEQLAQRFTGGRKTTLQGTLESLRRGNLGSNIRNSGLDEAQQRLLAQYMIDRSQGITMNLEDPEAISKAIARNDALGISNPMLEQYRQNAQDNQLMERATDSYLDGIAQASDALIELKKAVEGLPDMFFELKGGLEFFMGDKAGQGAVTTGASILGGLGSIASIGLGAYALSKGKNVFGKNGIFNLGRGKTPTVTPATPGLGASALYNPKTGNTFGEDAAKAGSKAGGFKIDPKVLKGGLKFGGALSAASLLLDAEANNQAAAQGMGGSAWGSSIGSAIGGTALGALGFAVPIPGLNVALGIGGGLLGGFLGGMAGSAIGSIFDAPNTGGATVKYSGTYSGGGSATINPGGDSGNWSGAYGESRYYGTHQGIDIPLAEGTKVYAAADGKVIAAQSGQGPRSYGLYVKIKHSDKYVTMYAHLSRIDVSVGQQVTKGQLIGLSGNTGFSTGPHLHFGLYKDGAAVDPRGWTSDDLTGGVERYSAGNNAGQAQGKKPPGSGGSIMDLILNPATGALAASSAISISASGVKGRQFTSAGLVGATMSGGLRSLSNPIEGAFGGTDAPAPGTGGGLDILTVQDTDSRRSKTGEEGSSTTVQHVHKNNITIQLTIPQATEAEARKFAKMIKEQMEEDSFLSKMGSK